MQSLQCLETYWRAFSLDPWSILSQLWKSILVYSGKNGSKATDGRCTLAHSRLHKVLKVKTPICVPPALQTFLPPPSVHPSSVHPYTCWRGWSYKDWSRDKLEGWRVMLSPSKGTGGADRTQLTNISQSSSWVGPDPGPSPTHPYLTSFLRPLVPPSLWTPSPNPLRNLAFLCILP